VELLQAIKERRSIRQFKPDPIPKAVLEDLIKNAMWAPSGMNTQPWKVVVLTGEKKQEFLHITDKAINLLDQRLKELFNDKMRTFIHGYFKDLGSAPAVVVVLTAIHEQDVYMLTSYQSSAAVLYNLLLLAHEAGLGTCWMTGQCWVEQDVLTFLDSPEWRLVGVTPIGYPDQVPPVPPRKHENIEWLD
jgi:nitroreductase